MVFWLVLAALTLAASLAVVLPLARRATPGAAGHRHDIEVYRDQIAEIDRDAARGLIGSGEAAEARAEIGRRILRLDGAAASDKAAARRSGRAIAAAAVLAIPLASWGLYAAFGSPDLPSQPLAARLAKAPDESSVEELVARAENHLRANPDDARGWSVLAPIYLRLGRAADAVTAYRNAMRVGGSTAALEAGYGEALTAAAGGIVTAEAVEAFERARNADPSDGKAGYYLATALAQEGRLDDAVAALRETIAGADPGSPWKGMAEQALARVEAGAGDAPATASGPTQDDIDAAAAMNGGDRAAMIEGMVAQLDERLRAAPADPEGWKRLVRSYMVLGREDDARDALARGLDALGRDDEDGLGLLRFAMALGLDEVKQP